MEGIEDSNCWEQLDCNFIEDSTNFNWTFPSDTTMVDFSMITNTCTEIRGPKRRRPQSPPKESNKVTESKAFRERIRREKMNQKFSELSSFLHPGTPMKSDRSAILRDAVSALKQLREQTQELKQKKTILEADINTLKMEKNELREEKLVLKSNRDKAEQQLKAMTLTSPPPTTPGVVPVQTGAAAAGATAVYAPPRYDKLMAVPNYGGGFPMWQWIPPAVLDTSQDHTLRPPVA